MIEKFTDKELEIIKAELGVKQTSGSKKSICSVQYKKIKEIFADAPEKGHSVYPDKKVWGALCVLCDVALRNYVKTDSLKNRGDNWNRYASIFDKDTYMQMMDELLQVFERYRKGSFEE